MSLPVYILAGGRSSRFGSDKARAEFEGVPLLLRLADTAAQVVGPVTVVAAEAGQYNALGLSTIGDEVPGRGPLGGLATALAHCNHDWLLLLACDLAHVQPAWLDTLVIAAIGTDGEVEAVLFDTTPLQPLLACYRPSILPQVVARRDGPARGMVGLLAELRVLRLPAPPDWDRLVNVNAPDDLAVARRASRGKR